MIDRREVPVGERRVDQRVDAPELGDGRLDESRTLRGVRDVRRDLDRPALHAERTNPRLCIVELYGRAGRQHHATRAFACGLHRELDAEARSDARYDHDHVLQQHVTHSFCEGLQSIADTLTRRPAN
jgi:hypothetical protein